MWPAAPARLALLAAGALASGCGAGPSTTTPPPPWDRTLPDARALGGQRGLVPARGIVHLHSPYSHDACDNRPRDPATGAPDEACLGHLRAALCATRVDFAALTDHDGSMADEDFPTLFSMRGGDQAVTNPAGEQIASRMTCPDGHVVTFTVGGENEIMPVMLDRHVPGTVAERHDAYNADTPAAVAAFRAAGGLAWIAHTEQRTVEHLRELAPDGVELYNLHANIDPKIRRDYLGLSSDGALAAVAQFADTNPGGPEPDLALLAFLSSSGPALDRWDALLGEGRRVAATAGTDAHENSLPITLADGERGDSYRRMMRWFANVALVADPQDPTAVEAALAAGRLYVAFEVLGSPAGLDVVAAAGDATTELGGEVAVAAGATLTVTVPTVLGLDPALPVPEISARLLRVDAGGRHELARGPGPVLRAPIDAPGAYRVEIAMIPRHLGGYLGFLGPELAEAELPWIYTGAIYAR